MNPPEVRLKVAMVRGLAGDAAAYAALLAELARLLRGFFARRLGGTHAECDDLVQETLIAIHTRRASYDAGHPFTPWVYAIAKYKFIDHLRRQGTRRHAPLEDAEGLAAEDWVDAATASSDLERLLADLPPKHRAAIRMIKLEGASVADAATETGMSPASVKVSVHRGLQRTMAKLRAGGGNAD